MGKLKFLEVFTYAYLIFNTPLCFAFDFVKTAKVDLNGDGKTENISISNITEFGDFVLKIDNVSIKGKFTMEEEADGFCIVDIDKVDKYKEIAVHTPGPSDDDEYIIFWYDGTSIKEMGRLSRWPEFLENGIVIVGDWMGFWIKKDKYVLNKKTRNFELVPQEFYYVGIEAKVKKSFPIYRTRNDLEVVANLKPNSKIIILVCAPSSIDYSSNWYLIKSETGLVGWTTESSLNNLEGLPWAD